MSQYKEAPTDPAAGTPAAPAESGAPHDLEPVPEIDQLRAELEQARTEAGENLDRFLRAKAEAENTRRRAEADVMAAHKYALDRFAAEIISVRDSLDLTLKLMDSVFQKFGVTLLDPKGQKFDPERHQAISMVESVEVPPGHVVNVVQKGYLLNDRLLRPAMVVVSRAAPAAAKPAGEA